MSTARAQQTLGDIDTATVTAKKELDTLELKGTKGGDSKLRWEDVKNNKQTPTKDGKWNASTNLGEETPTTRFGMTW